ncbi:alkaline phosphatase family protein [Nonomuraea sp. NPDC050556]|uniref:alkaline phosphatase family protein n=1 Tax=Nonomuraea sp. NPDC050556 TaxID=3364369 RepID=UPI003792EFC5
MKVLVVGMDGLRFDRLVALAPSVLTGLMATGTYGTSKLPYGQAAAPRTEEPGEVVPGGITSRTDSGPGWSSIATGVWPDKHGVVDNSFKEANFTKYPDFVTRAKVANPELTTYAIVSWAALGEHGAFSTDIDVRVVLDGYTDTFAACDARVAEQAATHLAQRGPDLSFVYFGDTDEVAHDLGPMGREYADALLRQDAYLGRLLEAVRSRDGEQWTVLVTTDHGHVDAGGHGGTSDEERTTFVILNRLGEDLGGVRLDEARLVDVAPTALTLLGVDPDPSFDGSFIKC